MGSLTLGVCALILGLMALLPWLQHHHAARDWPVATAEVLTRTVVTQYVNHKGPSFIVRDSYRIPGENPPADCRRDDPLGTGIRRWIDARLETRNRYWPVGSQVPVYREPYGDRCEPLGGFERAVGPTVAVVALAALACLAGIAVLRRCTAQAR